MNKKIINLLSLSAIIASPIALGAVYVHTTAPQVKAESVEIVTNRNFPLNKAQVINFEANKGFEKLTSRQKKEQLRDWLLFAVVSGKGLNSNQINQTVYDLPTVRYDFMSQVANFEHGETRSRYVGKGKVIAIVPKTDDKQQQIKNLASIGDRHRKNLGEKPKVIEVFEYDINPNNQSANITRRNNIDGDKVFSSEYGYYTTTINNESDLRKFIAQVNNITFAQVNGSTLTLAGRNIDDNSQAINLEDIAALWQSEQRIKERPQDFNYVNGSGFSLDPSFDYSGLQKVLDNNKSLIQAIKLNGKPVISEEDIKNAKQGLAKKDIVPYRQLSDKLSKFIKSEPGKKAFREGEIGKKLKQEVDTYKKRQDTEIDAELKRYKNQLRKEIKAEVVAAQKSDKLRADIEQELTVKTQQKEQQYQQFRDNLIKQKNEELDQFYKAKVKSKIAEIDKVLRGEINQGFIYARYDGDLQGTEVGMNLFYTDLLAKIWSFDYANSAPEESVEDFKAKKNISVSPIYKEELEKNSSTRIWFEPNTKEFQVADAGNKILFSPIATKVSARSHNPLEVEGDKNEQAANITSDKFNAFWNANYQEVAQFEPQYKKLNSIMKWSLLISWINNSRNSTSLNFLSDVKVKRDWNFANWVQANKNQLKFKNWATKPCSNQSEIIAEKPVCFYKSGDKEIKTETMPGLVSKTFKQFGQNVFLHGGVSLSDRNLFTQLPPINKYTSVDEVSLRPNIDYDSVKVVGDKLIFQTLPTANDLAKEGSKLSGTKYVFKRTNSFEVSTKITPQKNLKLRSKNVELVNQPISRKISTTLDGVKVESDIGGTEFGDLNVTKTANGFKVGFVSRSGDAGYTIASRASTYKGDNLPGYIAAIDDVESVKYSLSQPNELYVKLSSSNDEWVRLSTGGGGGGDKPPTRFMKVAEPEDGARNFNVQFLKDDEVLQRTKGYQEILASSKDFETRFDSSKQVKKLIEDPLQYKILKKQELQQRITGIDELLKAGEYKKASKLIDESIPHFSGDANLNLRKALIDINEGKRIVKEVNSQGEKIYSSNNLFDEINNRNYNSVETEEGVFFVQDSPQLNNLDFSQPIDESVSSGSGARFYKLEAAELSVGGNGNGSGGNGSGGGGSSNQSPNPGEGFNNISRFSRFNMRVNNASQAPINDSCKNEENSKNKETNSNCNQDKPIYIVTLPENKSVELTE
ncbi:hypothetical protein [Calothrix sp. CCY 0018]|uniref:hypothetical protein n=1 Tax=Calothrix sp. CCY 0018 TaxID=3103864 RepID=UPI0039C6258F